MGQTRALMAKTDTLPNSPGGDSRGLLIALGAGGLLAAVFAYAGPSWLVVLDQLLRDGLLLALWLLGAGGFGAACLFTTFRFDHDIRRHGVLLPVTAIAIGLGVISLVVLALGLVGWLNRTVALALLAAGVLLGAALFAWQWRDSLRQGVDERLRRWIGEPARWQWLWLLVIPPLAIALVGAILPPGMLWHPDEPHGYDVIEYHLQIPREWYEAGRIVPLEHNVFSYFPFNVEMHYLLAMHLRGGPWKGMYLAQLMHVSYAALTVLAVYGLSSALSKRRAAAVIAALAAAAVPWLTLLAPMAYNEAGLLLYGTLAIGWALLAIDAPPRAALVRLAVAGAMAGFACGVKLTAVPMLLLGVPVALAISHPKCTRYTPIYVAAGALLFAPWLLRNLAWTGNPVFPQATSFFGRAHFSDVQVERWKRAHSPTPAQSAPAARLAAGATEVFANWRFGYVPLVVGLVAAGLACRDRRGRALAVLLLLYLLFWLGFTHLQGRFFVLAIPVVALLIAVADWRRLFVPVAVAIALSVVGSWLLVHRQFAARMYGLRPWVQVLGAEDLSQLHPREMEFIPPDHTLVLVGDARAFWYQRPMKAMRYRTVFDVDTTGSADVVETWRGKGGERSREWLLIDPEELRRFAKTYWAVPAPPENLKDRKQSLLIGPSGQPMELTR
jgi:hypothetical protein